MELLIGIVVAVVAIVCAFGLGARLAYSIAAESAENFAFTQRIAQADDRRRLLDTFRREIANALVWRDPDRYVNFYQSLHAEVSAYSHWKPEELKARFDEMTKRYPFYSDFALFRTRAHVLYSDASGYLSGKQLEDGFADITRFQSSLCALDPHWKHFAPTSDDDLDHLIKYARQIKDTKLQLRLARAISDFELWCVSSNADMRDNFDSKDVAVLYVPHFAEIRYGIHLKDSDEFGLYNCFRTNDKSYVNYYRSNSTFKETQYLDVLRHVSEDYCNRLLPVPKEDNENW